MLSRLVHRWRPESPAALMRWQADPDRRERQRPRTGSGAAARAGTPLAAPCEWLRARKLIGNPLPSDGIPRVPSWNRRFYRPIVLFFDI
jgi:hypothetical protein